MRLRNWPVLAAALAATLLLSACGGGGGGNNNPPPPAVTVTVSPATATVNAGLTVQFTAAVANTSNTAVTWTVSGGGAISSSGLYTAPSTPPSGTVTVTATSQADTSAAASATVTVKPAISVTVSPATASVNAGLTQQFTAAVANTTNANVTWAVVGGSANGTISASGLYTAPATPPSGAVTVTATSQADPSASGSATVTVQPAITVTVSPATATVNAGLTQQFTAAVADTTNTAVTWTVTGGGTITSSGLYTAPSTPPSGAVTVTATSQADTSVSGAATVTVKPAVTVSVSPATASVNAGLTQQFTATVANTTNGNVTWAVVGGTANGTISSSGLYTAPSTPPSGAVTVTATSQLDPSASGSATVTVQPAVTVSVSPATASVNAGLTQQFTATVANTTNGNVNWAVVGGTANGTISSSGLYTAPATPPSGAVTVTATSQLDPSASGSATVTVQPAITVTVTAAASTVNAGLTDQFTATVNNNSDQNVTWQVNGTTGGDSTNGTISTGGLYTAPATPPASGTVNITATSATGSVVSSPYSLTVSPAVTVSVSPTNPSTVVAGATQQFTATVNNNTDQTVTWEVNGVTGGNSADGTISSVGLYTAPKLLPQGGGVTVTAVAQADSNATGNVSVTDGWSKASLNGNYVFVVQGTDGSGQQITGIGEFNANGSGGITGEEDFCGSTCVAATSGNLTGTYNVLADGRTAIGFTTSPEGSNLVFQLTLDANGNGRLIEQDSNASVTGSVWVQSSTAAPSGNYVFSLPHSIGLWSAASGAFTGTEDVNSNSGTLTTDGAIAGTLGTPDANGRAAMTLTPGGGSAVNYVYYVVSAGQIEIMESDGGAFAIGRADAQVSGSYNAAAFTGGYVFQNAGTQSASAGGASISASGQISANGSGGITSGTMDERVGTTNSLALAVSNTSSYTASSGTGEYTLTVKTPLSTQTYAAWMYSATGGFLLEMDANGDAQGTLAQQQNGPFATNALLGEYTLQLNGSADGTTTAIVQGELTALGGDFAGQVDSMIGGAVTNSLYLTGSYTVSSGGEAVGTLYVCSGSTAPTSASGCPTGDTLTFSTTLDFWIATATNSTTGTQSGRALVGEGDTTAYWQGTLTQQY
jgi:hypothetical protein